MPDPVPIVSPVVPLFMAPLLMPAPGLGRSVRLEPLAGFAAAGETAESPGGVVEVVLALCANAGEPVKTSADAAAIHTFFMASFPFVTPDATGFAGLCVSRQVGTTPMSLGDIRVGSHAVRIERDGYRIWTAPVNVTAGEQNRVTASLEK